MSDVAGETAQEELASVRSWRVSPEPIQPTTKSEIEETPSAALPMKIEGGFAGVTEDLDRRSRDWTMMVRLLEQQRLQLESAEAERARLYETLEQALPVAIESGRSLDEAIAATKTGDISSNLSALFAANLTGLDALENVSKALTANLLWSRSSWEQYARSVLGAQKMRESIRD